MRLVRRSSVCLAVQAVSLHRLAKTFQCELFSCSSGKVGRVLDITRVADQDLSSVRFALKARGEIHHVADGRIVLAVLGAQPADTGITGSNTDGCSEREAEAPA